MTFTVDGTQRKSECDELDKVLSNTVACLIAGGRMS